MPRPQSVQDDELYLRLAEVFRVAGYEGASLGALADAARLRRASLYHRFPDGKAQMAEAVLDLAERLYRVALEPLAEDLAAEEVPAAVTEAARRLGELYGGGTLSCVLDTLTLSGAPERVRNRAAGVAETWISAMAAAGERAGRPAAEARAAAEDAFARIEGGLVHQRLFSVSGPFERALADLPRMLVGAAAPVP